MSSKSHSKLTIAIPTYNGAAHLRAAISSVIAQQIPDSLIIVCDDGSTDGTMEIARSYESSHLIIVSNQSRKGLTGNWNSCVRLCASEYLCLFHQDDLMLPGNLSRKVALLDNNPEIGMVFSAVEVIDEQDDPVSETLVCRDKISTRECQFAAGQFLPTLLSRNVIRASSVVIRRETLDAVGCFDESYHHVVDWEMWLRLASKFGVGWISDPLVAVRWHQASETHRQRERDTDLAEYRRLLIEGVPRYLEQIDCPDQIRHNAWKNLAEGYLNRSYLCLRAYQDPRRARDNLLRSFQASPSILWKLLADPKFALMAAGVLLMPNITCRTLNRISTPPAIKDI